MIPAAAEEGRAASFPGVAAVVLAAGSSSRMGRNKMLLELDGETVAARAVRTACEAGLDRVVAVTGHAREEVEGALRGLPCRAVHNPDHAAGRHTSVAAGIAALGGVGRGGAARPDGGAGGSAALGAGGAAAAIVMLADMPFVTASMLRAVAARHAEAAEGRRPALVASRYGGGTVAPPILYDRRLFGELTALDRRCGRRVVERHLAGAALVDWPLGALRDLDRPADYERAVEALGAARDAADRGAGRPAAEAARGARRPAALAAREGGAP